MTATWGNRRLEERLAEIDAKAKEREEEARRPKTLEELTSLRAEEIEITDRTAKALSDGLAKQMEHAKRIARKMRSTSGNNAIESWFEAPLPSADERRTWKAEVTWDAMPMAYRVRMQSQLVGGITVLEAHFLIPEEALDRHSRDKFEYGRWMHDIGEFIYAGNARPPSAAYVGRSSAHTFESLGLIDQTGPAPVPELDPSEAIASIRRAFEEEDD
jgi:hypothetical protein